ncbi:protein CONSERVED ONLY IN THE GREEN LINEAGE 160, chloroplastic-like [Bidens hawaiensis]|uniref:protein CONSERVED ONLY IN THE GREEN LINEAGE 160, chloroplastic-like n=1 Tax=Bidens hawaiensis TaxID=980011 RepID=UPI004049A550
MAAISCRYLTVTCTATPINQQDSNSATLPTKIILPNKKPQKWSTGVAPGDYGGPPTTTKLRKYWGGEKEDPLTSDELIWNNDFMPHMKRIIGDSNPNPTVSPVKEEPSGFLSLNRAMSLDSMEVDLSKKLTTSTPVVEKQVKPSQGTNTMSRKWKPAPTRREQDKWNRATKAATGGSDVMFREARRPKGDPQLLAAKSREQYKELKNKMQILTLAIGGVGLVSAYVSYTPEIAASYGAGLVGSLIYMRMLGNSIDGMAGGARGVIKGAIGQPRLLVPVALVMIYNRWNGIIVPEYGLMHLELIPMLVGFFTYKIATFTQAIEEAVSVVSKDAQFD